MLDERLQFGSAGSLTLWNRVILPANHQMRLFNKLKNCQCQFFFFLSKFWQSEIFYFLFCMNTYSNWIVTHIFILFLRYFENSLLFLFFERDYILTYCFWVNTYLNNRFRNLFCSKEANGFFGLSISYLKYYIEINSYDIQL